MEEQANEKHVAFAVQLARLNGAMAELAKTGDGGLLLEMHAAIQELYKLQNGSDDDVFRTITPDCEVIYENFDMIIALCRTVEGETLDPAAQKAIDKFLHNIDDAVVNIASLLGVV